MMISESYDRVICTGDMSNRQCKVGVTPMPAHESFDAPQPNVHESTWHPQHECALREGVSEVVRLQYEGEEGNHSE